MDHHGWNARIGEIYLYILGAGECFSVFCWLMLCHGHVSA